MTRVVESAIEDGLGYCCPYAFFSIFRQNKMIRERIGVERRAIATWKKKLRDGKLQCKCKEKCLKDKIPEARFVLRLIRSDASSASFSSPPTASESPRRPD